MMTDSLTLKQQADVFASQIEDAEVVSQRNEISNTGGDDCQADTVVINKLKKLNAIDYDRVRKEEAEKLGVSAAALDKAVNAAKRNKDTDDGGFVDVEPWDSPINPSELISDISDAVSRFVVCDREAADAAALWVSMTWFVDVIQIAPLAVITAPEKRCGKTQMLTILGKLSYRPLSASNISPAALYRCIDAWQPTLLLDETDAFMRENEELRGVINSGHSRDNAYVIRTVGDDFTPKRFSTWGAKALSGIGHLSDTLMDRSIILELRRKLDHEHVDRLRYAEPGLFSTLSRKLARFADDYRDRVRNARPVLPHVLNDRQQDNWEPLLAIAGLAGSEWIDRANKAALKLSAGDDSTSTANELLADIHEIFETKRAQKISTADLIHELISDDMRAWATYNRGRPLTPRQLAKKLKGYGIQPKNLRIGNQVLKGFSKQQFEESFSRYLAPPDLSATALQTSTSNGCSVAKENSVAATNRVSATDHDTVLL